MQQQQIDRANDLKIVGGDIIKLKELKDLTVYEYHEYLEYLQSKNN
jgi:hypothetical protein